MFLHIFLDFFNPDEYTSFIVLIGPSTLPIYFRMQYEPETSRVAYDDGDWFLQVVVGG
jgi:hypothetical protein